MNFVYIKNYNFAFILVTDLNVTLKIRTYNEHVEAYGTYCRYLL